MGKKKFYITAAIPYVNARPHIGHALEFVQGDIIARYRKMAGDDVFYASGADENSLKNVRAAQEAGITPKELCDRNAKAFADLAKALNVQFDAFLGSSSKENVESSQDLWRRCAANGDIYKKKYRGLYCVGCELFYTKDELNEKGECFEHPGKPLEEVEEENYFFRLSRYKDKLLKFIEGDYQIIPEHRKNEALQFIKSEGFGDFSISRSLARSHGWGVPVPDEPGTGLPAGRQVMYVWFDALNVYRSAAPTRWPAQVHLIGKGILRFHAVYWPAILMSAKLPLPETLVVHGYITVEGQKMSKTIGNVLDPFELLKKLESHGLSREQAVDAFRYFVAREVNMFEDSDYSWEKFKESYNAHLANGLGNNVRRIMKMAVDRGAQYSIPSTAVSTGFLSSLEKFDIKTAIDAIIGGIEIFDKPLEKLTEEQLDEYIREGDLRPLSVSGSDSTIAAWETYKLPQESSLASKETEVLVRKLWHTAVALESFMPYTSSVIKQAIQKKQVIPPLFPRIS
jgi:methionyl-tRNA synthetase